MKACILTILVGLLSDLQPVGYMWCTDVFTVDRIRRLPLAYNLQHHVELPKASRACNDSKAQYTAVFVVRIPASYIEWYGTNSGHSSSEVGFLQPVAVTILENDSACMYICTETKVHPRVAYLISAQE